MADIQQERIAFGSVAPTPAATALRTYLASQNQELIDIDPPAGEEISWPDIGHTVAQVIAEGRADRGVALCWTGIGVAISGNSFPGVRAAYCTNSTDARNARQWHDANLLAVSLDEDRDDLFEIARVWLATVPFDEPGHARAQRRMDHLLTSA